MLPVFDRTYLKEPFSFDNSPSLVFLTTVYYPLQENCSKDRDLPKRKLFKSKRNERHNKGCELMRQQWAK